MIQTTSVVPSETLTTKVFGFMSFKLLLFSFGDECKVSSFSSSGFNNPNEWNMTTSLVNSTCVVEYVNKNGSLIGSTHLLRFKFLQPFAMASSIGYVITFPNYASSQNAQITEVVQPTNATTTVFRGPATTEFSLSFTTTQFSQINGYDFFFYNLISKIFNIASMNTIRVGYTIVQNQPTLGTTLQSNNFWNSPGELQVDFRITSNPNAYAIQQLGKSTVLDFVGKIAALVGAAMAIVAAVMANMEMLWTQHKQKQNAKQANKVIAHELGEIAS